jgi:hypothetical protein
MLARGQARRAQPELLGERALGVHQLERAGPGGERLSLIAASEVGVVEDRPRVAIRCLRYVGVEQREGAIQVAEHAGGARSREEDLPVKIARVRRIELEAWERGEDLFAERVECTCFVAIREASRRHAGLLPVDHRHRTTGAIAITSRTAPCK